MVLRFHSTNYNTPKVDFKTALLTGLALDEGLYTADEYPQFQEKELLELSELNYQELGYAILSKLIGDQLPVNVLKNITKDAYNFPVPIEQVYRNWYVLRLDKGPTASFKDFAARTMARLMQYFTTQDNRELLILTATSGDTGGAVASAFYGMDNIKVVVLFPIDEVSDRQRKQMTTLGKNVTAVAIKGKFDDCQALVKRAFADPDLKELNLSSANSINVGRLLPQSIYYFWAFFRVNEQKIKEGSYDQIIISIPSGNFGNLMGGFIAKHMGLPVKKFIAAVNENDAVPVFLRTGKYEKVIPSRKCLSNAMNVGHPSNLARIVDLFGGVMDQDGNIPRMPHLNWLRRDLDSFSISDDETKEIIAYVYEKYDYVLEPHGAVGWGGLMKYLDKNRTKLPCITFETADPAKFPDEIQKILGINPTMPSTLKEMQEKDESYVHLEGDFESFKKFLNEQFSKEIIAQ
ncbi:MAG: threonine synthase [Candidatus Helarchaeota archaeon]|nr:threonine synthase [Candidatus Helarchaeota archaeon]